MAAGDRKYPDRFASSKTSERGSSDALFALIPIVGLLVTIWLVFFR